jgi:hypothetical protein
MGFFDQLGMDIVAPLVGLWNAFVVALPYVIGGLIVLAFGYLLGEVLEVVLISFLKKIKFNEFIHGLKISPKFESFDMAHLIGVIIKWYVFVIFLAPAASLAKLGSFSEILMDFARWLPSLMVGLVILLLGWIGADIVANKINDTKIKSKGFVANLVKITLLVFVLIVSLEEVGVKLTLIHEILIILFASIALGISLAFGIGFGLALKDEASSLIKGVKKKL